jgi:serine/threonine-protein kinase
LEQPFERRQGTRSGFGLPSDLLETSRHRLRIVGVLVLIASGVDVVMMLIDLAAMTTGGQVEVPPATLIPFAGNAVTLILSAGIVLAARSRRIRSARLLDLGLAFEVMLCAIISVTNPLSFYESAGVLPIMTWVTPLIILFPLIVPCPPRRTLVTAVLAALMAPLGLLVLDLAGVLDASLDAVASISFSPALAVVMAFYGSRVVYGLGLEVADARRMGSYQLERLLGRGGMGEVWLARHRLLARPAAIKLVRPDLAALRGPEPNVMLQRFEREAQATASLRCPHTIELYDFGVADDGTFYYVMELLDGLDAQSLVERFGPVPAERAVHILTQVCASLAEAHDRGLVHRDIKPANIYVCRYGRELDFVKVLDFGLVKAIDSTHGDDVRLTRENVISGTPAYMAPEQHLGRAQDARSDIYAVGCTAYWLLTGQRVFEGDSAMQILMHHACTVPVPPSQRTEVSLPTALERVVLACLDKDPDRRPPSADDLSARLMACRAEPWPRAEALRWWDHHQPVGGESMVQTSGHSPL